VTSWPRRRADWNLRGPQQPGAESQPLKTIEKRPLARENSLARQGNSEPFGAIDFRNGYHTAAPRRPFDRDLVAAHGADIEGAFQRIGQNELAAALAYLSERPQRTCRGDADFLREFAAGCRFPVFAAVQFPLWDGPGAEIAVSPKRSAWMDE